VSAPPALESGQATAVRETALFRQDVAHVQAAADLAYRTGGSIWLSEWHAHPASLSRPSQLDLTSYRRMLSDSALAFTFLLAMMVIPGLSGGWRRPRLTGWVVSIADIWPVLLRSRIHTGGFTE